MEKLRWWMLCLLLLGISCSRSARAQDVRTAEVIGLNSAAAEAQELLLSIQHDSISEKRLKEGLAVTLRMALRLQDLAERENLDNFKNENRTYQRARYVISSLAENLQYLLEGARKNPGNMVIFYKAVANVSITAVECFNRMVTIGMKGKVKTLDAIKDLTNPEGNSPLPPPPSGSGNKKEDDGYNLLTSAERVELMEECIGELRTLNRAIYRMAYKLNTEVAWTYFFHEATPYHYRKVNAIISATESAKEDIKKLNWF